MSKKEKEESVCLTRIQLEHIVDAARDEPGTCPKARDFVLKLKKGSKKVGPTKKEGTIIERHIGHHINKRISDVIGDVIDRLF
jgi:hypothetical protein